MINCYERAKAQPEIFNPLVCKDLLVVHYDCPLESNDRINGYSTITFNTFSLEKRLITLRIGLSYLQKIVLYS